MPISNAERYRLTFVRRRREFGAIHTLLFRPDAPLPFRAGQWIHLAATAAPGDRSLVRHMSICSAPGDELLEFTMDLGSGSEYKRRIAALESGDEVAAFKLRGDFVVDRGDRAPVVFVAGGLGITPARSILRDLGPGASGPPRSLLHVARDGHLFAEELSRLGPQQWRCDRAGLDALWPEALASAGPDGLFYLSGSARFVEGMAARLAEAGIGPERIRTEDFNRQ